MVPAERHALGQSAKVERVTGPAQPDCAHRGESPMAYCTHLSKRTSELRRMLSRSRAGSRSHKAGVSQSLTRKKTAVTILRGLNSLAQKYFAGLSKNTFLLACSSLLADISTEMLYPVLPVFLTQTLNPSGSVVGTRGNQ
jgi:hypothetical protein